MPSPVSRLSIDSHPQKRLIVRRIIDGLSLRQVVEGLVPPVSANTVQRYKANVIKPVIQREVARENFSIRQNEEIVSTVSLTEGTKLVERVTDEVANAPVMSIFRQRLEHLNGIVQRTLVKAETSVRVATDKDGNTVVIGADLGVLAPLLNQAHKNVEMLGRATGELEPTGGGSVSIQILCPTAGASVDQLPRITFSSIDAIEAHVEQHQPDETSEDIGVLQAP